MGKLRSGLRQAVHQIVSKTVQVTNITISSSSPELARVEACLDENPDFFLASLLLLLQLHLHSLLFLLTLIMQDYFLRKASRSMIDAWLTAHALPPREEGDPPSTPASR